MDQVQNAKVTVTLLVVGCWLATSQLWEVLATVIKSMLESVLRDQCQHAPLHAQLPYTSAAQDPSISPVHEQVPVSPHSKPFLYRNCKIKEIAVSSIYLFTEQRVKIRCDVSVNILRNFQCGYLQLSEGQASKQWPSIDTAEGT